MENNFDIAVIGMACRFPGADNPDEFWKNLTEGTESIREFSTEELKAAGIPESLINNPHYVRASPVINDPDKFDAAFFGYTPAEAKTMDPQQRILLECAWNALENSGYDSEKFNGRIGVFTGSAMNTYFMNTVLRSRFVDEYIPTLISNDKDFVSTRISYKLNLTGPSINVQTACSTSLVAVHLACQSLISQESDMVLAGAVSVKVPHSAGYIADGGGIVSPDAHVKAFDAKANGTVFGSGCGVVVLKRLNEALKDNDTILAVIKASVVNNDGSEKAGYTAPAVNSQANAVTEALTLADINPETVTYIETHGSGTPIGDPIEIAALTKAFRNFTAKKQYCAVGSVKTNIGHLDAAAGIAGMIKAILALRNRKLPPSLNFSNPNPEIDFRNSPFFVGTELTEWHAAGIRRAGVISTGMGGTNACIIMEEAPVKHNYAFENKPQLLIWSAKDEETLSKKIRQLGEFLTEEQPVLRDAAYTLQSGRRSFNHRGFLVSSDSKDAAEQLLHGKSKRVFTRHLRGTSRRPIVFLFPGIGDHYVGMGYDLYSNVKFFRDEVDKCAGILRNYLETDIRDILYPADYIENKNVAQGGIDLKKMLAGRVNNSADPNTQRLNKTLYVQPALFTIEYALSRLWMHLGIKPDAIAGHSMGEYTAACLAGVLSLEDALRLIARRAKMVNELPPGAMLAVSLPAIELEPLLLQGISVSLINSPDLCVVAGPEDRIREFRYLLDDKKILYRQVQNGHAFHSRMLDPVQDNFIREVRQARLNLPEIPYTSNLTGNWISAKEATDPFYWAKHSNHTARFSDCIETVWKLKNPVLLEMGPGNTLSVLALKHPSNMAGDNTSAISSLRPDYDNQSDLNYLLTAAGKLWLSGYELSWDKLYEGEKPQRIPLPLYPFRKEKHWLEIITDNKTGSNPAEVIHKNPDINEWYYLPSWKRVLPVYSKRGDIVKQIGKNHVWLLFTDDKGISSRIAGHLRKEHQQVITVSAGSSYNSSDGNYYSIIPGDYPGYDRMISDLKEKNQVPEFIIHAWNVSGSEGSHKGEESFSRQQERGFYSLLYLVKALSKNNISDNLKLFVLSSGIQDVTGAEDLCAEKSTSLGPCLVIPQEYQNITTKSIDIEPKEYEHGTVKYIDMILGEFLQGSEKFIAHRSGQRWVQMYEQVKLRKHDPVFRPKGVYLITGGLGEVGYVMAKHLADTYRARLVIVSRTALPTRSKWNVQGNPDEINKKIMQIKALEESGNEVLYFNTNVSDEDGMNEVIMNAYRHFGELNGVIHAAGIVGRKGFSAIQDMDEAKCEPHFQAKVRGLYVLEKILEGKSIDFCMLMSSLTPVLGGLREAAYSSSNIFMDSFARKYNGSGTIRWMSVNWDLWRLHDSSDSDHHIGKTLSELGITADEGVVALESVLSLNNVPQLVVSTGDLNARINQWVKLESLDKKNHTGSNGSSESSPDSHDIFSGQTEKKLVNISKEVLGSGEVTENDNFFELGGHSLLAIQLISAIRKNFGIDIGLDDIFNSATLKEMAEKINKLVSMKDLKITGTYN